MNKEDFLKIKETYKSARTEERIRIIDFITKKNDKEGNFLFTKSKDKPYTTRNQYSGGRGDKKYTSGSRLSRPYDLSNHMWIDLSYKGNDILISLQSFDIDPNSYNLHVLYDRIGIIFGKNEESDDKDGKPDNELKVSDDFLKRKQQTGNYLYLKQIWRRWWTILLIIMKNKKLSFPLTSIHFPCKIE